MYQKISGSWRPVANPFLEIAGAWRAVTKGWVKVAGVWRQFFGPLSVGLDTTTATASGSAGLLTSNTVTASGVQGVPAYIYAWQYVSGDVGPAPTSGMTATTAWSAISGPSTVLAAVWRCKVTDMNGNIAYSANVSVTLNYT